ncbi:MAG: zinc ribbon domain-containing protein [Candidatus Acidiferrales bacterium]
MPIYEYICEECNERFEHLALHTADHTEKAAACPRCGSRRHSLQFSVFAPAAGSNGKSASSASTSASASSCCGGGCGCGRN